MKNTLTILLLLSIFSGANANEETTINNGFISGKEYLDFSKSARQRYVMGIIDGILISPMFGSSELKISAIVSCLKPMTSDQLSAVLTKRLNENPKMWHLSAHLVFYQALYKICPSIQK